jgi:hypothetical protein
VDVVEATSALRITVPDDLATGTFAIVVERGSQASTEPGEEPDPVSLFDVAVKQRFGFDQKNHGGGIDFDLPDESEAGQGLIYTVRKVDNLDPDYTTVRLSFTCCATRKLVKHVPDVRVFLFTGIGHGVVQARYSYVGGELR